MRIPTLSLLTLSTITTLLCLAAPTTAQAQSCGNWREAVLCTGELQLRDEDGRWNRYEPDREPLAIAPGGSVEIELTGRDQTGRTFPAYRLALATDSRDCDRYLEVEDLGEGRIRLEAARSEGRCRLEVWLPGNLNFAWRIDVSVAFAARTTYDRDEAAFVARRLYLAVLGREADPGGLSAATAEIARGNLEQQIRSMVTSEEFLSRQRAMDSGALLDQFFQGLLGRQPDSTGVRTFSDDMGFRRYTDVLLGLIRSAEFEAAMEQGR